MEWHSRASKTISGNQRMLEQISWNQGNTHQRQSTTINRNERKCKESTHSREITQMPIMPRCPIGPWRLREASWKLSIGNPTDFQEIKVEGNQRRSEDIKDSWSNSNVKSHNSDCDVAPYMCVLATCVGMRVDLHIPKPRLIKKTDIIKSLNSHADSYLYSYRTSVGPCGYLF